MSLNCNKSKTETEIKREIIKYLKDRDWYVFRLHTTTISRKFQMCPPGTPDILSVSPKGRHLWIEVKKPNGKTREDQVIMIMNLQKRNCEVIYAYSVFDVAKVVENDR